MQGIHASEANVLWFCFEEIVTKHFEVLVLVTGRSSNARKGQLDLTVVPSHSLRKGPGSPYDQHIHSIYPTYAPILYGGNAN